jgi:hypothetical protein
MTVVKAYQLQYQKLTNYNGKSLPTTVTTANLCDCGKSKPTRVVKDYQLQYQKIIKYSIKSQRWAALFF